MNIFDFIECKSYQIADYIGRGDTEEEIELYRYSIFMIVSHIFTEVVGVVLSICFGYFIPYIICSITFTLLRVGAGGYHCKTFRQCFFTSNTLFAIGALTTIIMQSHPLFMWLLSIYSAIFMLPTYPKPSENSPSRGYSEDIRFRKKYRNSFLVLSILSLIFYNFNFFLFSVSISSGILLVSFITSDFGGNIIKKIWSIKDI